MSCYKMQVGSFIFIVIILLQMTSFRFHINLLHLSSFYSNLLSLKSLFLSEFLHIPILLGEYDRKENLMSRQS